jgi:catabolite regulation protein CreA
MSSGWNRKKKVYARKKQHDETHKVSELFDQNNDTLFYLHHNQKRHK